ncbi:MAG: hypothetical protein ACK4SA_23120 [Caldilinea sp.]
MFRALFFARYAPGIVSADFYIGQNGGAQKFLNRLKNVLASKRVIRYNGCVSSQ